MGKPIRTIPQISDILLELDEGQLEPRMSTGLAELVKAAIETNKKGVFTLKLTVHPEKSTARVAADWSIKKPVAAAASTTFFADENGALCKEDPRQLPLRRVLERPIQAAPTTPAAPIVADDRTRIPLTTIPGPDGLINVTVSLPAGEKE